MNIAIARTEKNKTKKNGNRKNMEIEKIWRQKKLKRNEKQKIQFKD